MAQPIRHFIHPSQVNGGQALATSLSLTAVHVHDLGESLPAFLSQGNWRGILGLLVVKVAGSVSPTTVTARVCADAGGDDVIVPDVTATLVPGLTTAAVKTAAFDIDVPAAQLLGSANQTLYVFAAVDDVTGGPVLAQTTLTWRE